MLYFVKLVSALALWAICVVAMAHFMGFDRDK